MKTRGRSQVRLWLRAICAPSDSAPEKDSVERNAFRMSKARTTLNGVERRLLFQGFTAEDHFWQRSTKSPIRRAMRTSVCHPCFFSSGATRLVQKVDELRDHPFFCCRTQILSFAEDKRALF